MELTLKEKLRNAGRSLKRELFGFRFDYPLQIVPEAASAGSLHYHLYSDTLRWEAMRMGTDGVPKVWERATGAVYWPSYIAWYGLVQLGSCLRHRNDESLNAFLNQVSWLEQNAVVRGDGAVVWPLNFDYTAGPVVLKAPWISAYVQGLVISALVRAFRLTKRPQFMELLRGSTRVFQLTVVDSGVRVLLDNHALYAELPGGPPPGILDGFMTALLGLYDLSVETGDSVVGGLFQEGIEGSSTRFPAGTIEESGAGTAPARILARLLITAKIACFCRSWLAFLTNPF